MEQENISPKPVRPIGKDDLEMLMSSYGNMVELNTLISQQIKQIIDMQRDILAKQENITLKQKGTCDALSNMVSKINDMTSIFKEMQPILTEGHEEIIEKVSSLKEKMLSVDVEDAKNVSKITSKIYIAWGMTGAIIVSLITLIISIMNKFEKLESMYNLLIAISKKMGIVVAGG